MEKGEGRKVEIVTIFHFLPSSLSSFLSRSIQWKVKISIEGGGGGGGREGTENAYQNGVSFKPPAQTHISRPFFWAPIPPKTQQILGRIRNVGSSN